MSRRPKRISYTARMLRPMTWSRSTRRVVLSTLPVSLPLWLLALVFALLADAVAPLVRAIGKLWNGDRRSVYRSTSYSYGDMPKRRRRAPPGGPLPELSADVVERSDREAS